MNLCVVIWKPVGRTEPTDGTAKSDYTPVLISFWFLSLMPVDIFKDFSTMMKRAFEL